MSDVDLKKLLKRVVELVMPNLRHYYRLLRKGLVVKSYASDGSYWVDVQPLRNDDSVDEREPVISRVEIPILWGGPDRGVVCPPAPGTLCDITYYDGDPNYPRISNFRWARNRAPACEVGAFIIQQAPGIFIKITPEGNIVHKTGADLVNETGGDKSETVGGSWGIEVSGDALIKAPQITLDGEVMVTGNLTAGGNISDMGGAKSMSGMRETYNQHTHQGGGAGLPSQEM